LIAVKGKGAAILFCLAFALPFGGVGAGATWAMATMIYDGLRAKEWVRVKADVGDRWTYRYAFNGASHTSDRLGTFRLGGTSDVDDFDERVAALFAQAREEKRPITVFVNPDKPSEAMVDRTIRWGFLIFLVPFGLAFGAVGVGALVVLVGLLRKPAKAAARPLDSPAAGLAGLWLFAIIWNSISFPVAALAVPQAIEQGDWGLLFILIFPLVGVLILWGAIAATFAQLRRGKPTFHLATRSPRVGGPLEGHFEFTRGVRAGDTFDVRALCERTFRNGENTSITPHWTKSLKAKAVATSTGMRVPFRFEIPASLPAGDEEDADRAVTHAWRVELDAHKHAIPMARSSLDTPAAASSIEEPVRRGREAPSDRIDASLQQVLGNFGAGELTAEQKQALARMTPAQQAALANVLRFRPSPKKVVIAIVAFLVVIELIPFLFRTLAR
jgi:hypothetical protein